MVQAFKVAFLLALTLPQTLMASEMLLFGGKGHDVFLGCFNCNEFTPEAICNDFGAGSAFKSDSIFNKFGRFGSSFSSSSPWNEFTSSTEVPVLVGRDGSFYGYFTINKFRSDAVAFSDSIAQIFKVANGELEVVRNLLCDTLNS